MYKTLKNRVMPYVAAGLIAMSGGSALAAEKADNYGANLIAGTAGQLAIAPGKVINRAIIGAGVAGYDGLKEGTNFPLVKEVPGLTNLVGGLTGLIGTAANGVGYAAIDTGENLVLAPAGYKGSGPEDLGDISAKLDETAIGRTAVALGVGAGVGAIWAKSNGISIFHGHRVHATQGEWQGAGLIGAITGGSQTINEIEE